MTRWVVNLTAILFFLFTTFVTVAQVKEPTIVRKQVSLRSGELIISTVELQNTHKRFYTDAFSGNKCDLTSKAEGVIWVIVCEGKDIPAKSVSVQTTEGRMFNQTCWSSQGGVSKLDAKGNRIGGGPQTKFLAVGPDDARAVIIKFGEASVKIEIPR
jgi:hypothetical protein